MKSKTETSFQKAAGKLLRPLAGIAFAGTLLLITLNGCKQETEVSADALTTGTKGRAGTSTQQKPGGKLYFSVAVGNLDNTGTTFVRIVNMTFNDAAGTVDATAYEWISSNKVGKTAIYSHSCGFNGSTPQSTSVYAPTGWMVGGSVNPDHPWSGTYTYVNNVLTITWTAGKTGTEEWNVTNPTTKLARLTLKSSSTAMGYTHGRGYGSNSPWSVKKTLTDIFNNGAPVYAETYSRMAESSYRDGVRTISPNTTNWNSWIKTNMNLAAFTKINANIAHRWESDGYSDPGGCTTGYDPNKMGIIYHLTSKNDNRALAYVNHASCLSPASVWPKYEGNNHPSGFMQIIDDDGTLVALVGIEAQNPSNNVNWQFHLWDFNNIP